MNFPRSPLVKPPPSRGAANPVNLNRDHPLAFGLVGGWLMNEGAYVYDYVRTGTGGDSLGTFSGTPAFVPSHFGPVVELQSANSEFISIFGTNTATHRLKPSLPLTIVARVRVASVTANRPIYISEGSAANIAGFQLLINTSGNVVVRYGDNTGTGSTAHRTKTGGSALTTALWYDVVAVIRGATDMSLYVNGIDDGGSYTGTGGAISFTSAGSNIGRMGSGGTVHYDGELGHVYLYNRDLTAHEAWLVSREPYGMFVTAVPGRKHQFIDFSPSISRTVPTDAALIATVARSVPSTAALTATATRSVPSDAALVATLARSVGTSAALVATIARTVGTDAVLLATVARTATTSAVLLTTNTRTVTTSAVLTTALSRTVTTEAVLTATVARSVPTSAALLSTLVRTVATSAALVSTTARSVTTSATLLATIVRTVTTSGALVATAARPVPTEAVLTTAPTIRTVPTTVALTATLTRTITTSGALIATLARLVPTSASLVTTLARSISSTAVLTATVTRTVGTSAVVAGAFVRTVPTSAVLATLTTEGVLDITTASTGSITITVTPP